MPKTADIDPEAEARRVAAPAIESILKDYRAIDRREQTITDRRQAPHIARLRENADWLLRHERTSRHLNFSDARRETLRKHASEHPKAGTLGVAPDGGRDQRVIARRERAVERKLEAVEREHGPLVRVGVQLAALLDQLADLTPDTTA